MSIANTKSCFAANVTNSSHCASVSAIGSQATSCRLDIITARPTS